MNGISSEAVFKVGIFLPLLVTNSLIVTKSETRFLKKKKLPMMLDVLCHTLGFYIVIMIVGIIRELFGNGSFLGHAVDLPVIFPVLMLPFGGFILVGFLAAAVQKFVGIIRELFGNGSFLGHAVDLPVIFPVLMLPFGGFILVGFLAAAVQKFRLYLEEFSKRQTKTGRDKE